MALNVTLEKVTILASRMHAISVPVGGQDHRLYFRDKQAAYAFVQALARVNGDDCEWLVTEA